MPASNHPRKMYRVRYDRIITCLAILIVLILMLTSCVTSCTKSGDSESTTDNQIIDNLSSTDEGSATATAESGVESDANYDSSEISASSTLDIAYATTSLGYEDIYSGDLVLVNSTYACQFDTAAIEAGTSTDLDFVTIKSILDTKTTKHYTAADWVVGMDSTAANAMDEWLEAFYAQTGLTDLRMIRGYTADSEDLDFRAGRTCTIGVYPTDSGSYPYKESGDYTWLGQHAYEYGFVLRYPEGKESYFDSTITDRTTATFRYVGVAAATYMYQNNLCLEEYLELVKDYTIDNMLKITSSNASYGVYYVAANPNGETSFSVPTDSSTYTVSGNNYDGFVITVTLS